MDFNSIIHNVASKSNTNDFDVIIANILKEVERIVANVITPSELLFIAIDGMCPVAKMIQQRKRRFLNSVDNNDGWNSNIVTPGTNFMTKLDKALDEWSLGINTYQIIISKSSDFGEGEHKIFQHMKHHNNKDCVIIGMDADLIMLSLLHTQNNIILSRDDSTSINIKNLRKSIEKEYGINILTYVSLCFFMGNDFLPPLSYFNIKNHGIEKIITAFKRIDMPLICYDREKYTYLKNIGIKNPSILAIITKNCSMETIFNHTATIIFKVFFGYSNIIQTIVLHQKPGSTHIRIHH
jgi:5'-3' exonuclease